MIHTEESSKRIPNESLIFYTMMHLLKLYDDTMQEYLLDMPAFEYLDDEDMTTLETTKNISYMHIC